MLHYQTLLLHRSRTAKTLARNIAIFLLHASSVSDFILTRVLYQEVQQVFIVLQAISNKR